jgi:hypothetical protein
MGNPEGGTGRSAGKSPLFQAGLLRLLKVDPLDPWDLTRALREGRRQIWQRFRAKKARPGEEGLFLAGIAGHPGVRSSRRIRGRATSTAEDAWELGKHADGIARCSWEIDIHPPDTPTGKGVAFDDPAYVPRMRRTEAGDWFDVRYGCLVPEGVEDLLVAGRCVSADHEAQACLRIQQTCMAMGQAAGTAGALSLQAGLPPAQLDAGDLIEQLARDRDVEPAFELLPSGARS